MQQLEVLIVMLAHERLLPADGRKEPQLRLTALAAAPVAAAPL